MPVVLARFACLVVVAACSAPAPVASTPAPVDRCKHTRTVRVVDEAGAPLAGARVRAVANYRTCGPSGMPEGCAYLADDSPTAVTDATGRAVVCDVATAAALRGPEPPIVFRGSSGTVVLPPSHQGQVHGSFVVEYADWPSTRVPFDRAASLMTARAPLEPTSITMGPARGLLVEVPTVCTGMSHVQVSAYAPDAGAMVHAKPLEGGLRTRRYRIEGLGPWPYWVSTRDDRASAGECPSFVRFVDAKQPPATLVVDRSDAVVDFPAFANGRATVRAFNRDDIIVEATLDARGRATLALPGTSGGTYCLRLDHGGTCRMTYARAGETATPALYAGRESSIAASCGRCD